MLFLMIKTVKLTQKNPYRLADKDFLALFVLLAEEGGGSLYQLLLGHIGGVGI